MEGINSRRDVMLIEMTPANRPLGSGLAIVYQLVQCYSMARPLHIEYPGTAYRVTARGNARLQVFEDDADQAALLDLKEITRCEGLIFRPSLIELFPSVESFGKEERKELIRKACLDNGYSFTDSKANRVALCRESNYEVEVMDYVGLCRNPRRDPVQPAG